MAPTPPSAPQTLSLAMIVKNEEEVLGRLLASAASFVDEVVVVDTGSSDRTIEIAREHGAQVYDFAWVDDFAAARNHAFARATKDWILWLDADDIVPAKAQAAFSALKAGHMANPHVDTLMVPYVVAFEADGQPKEVFDRERVVRRAANMRWESPVHETLILSAGQVLRAPEAWVEHHPLPGLAGRKIGRNLRIMEARIDVHTSSPHMAYQFACELQWNNQPTRAGAAFKVYLDRVRGRPDYAGHQYLAGIKRGECIANLGEVDEGVESCLDAIALAPHRAEAHCLAGEILANHGRWAEAWPFLLVAATLPMPPRQGPSVFSWFYGERARKSLARCLPHQANVPPHIRSLCHASARSP